ncbi:unnamed protein product [Pylaiella littoralis]
MMKIWFLPILLSTGIVIVAVVSAVHRKHAPHNHTARLGRQQPDLLGAWEEEDDLDNRGVVGDKLRRSGSSGSVREEDREAVEVGAGSPQRVELDVSLKTQSDGEEEEENEENEDTRPLPDYEYTGWSPELSAGSGGADGSRARLVVSGVASPPGGIFKNALSVYNEIRGDILERWGSKYANTTLFSGGMEFSDGGKVVEEKMLNAVLGQRGFLAAFTGISTTAGHDCLYEESYPVVLNATLGRLMAAAGVRFEAINVAMGNTRVAPYSFCVDAHAGYEADIISWDMYMMLAGKAPAPPGLELFIRSASVLPRRPAVLLTDATPNNEDCLAARNSARRRNIGIFAGGKHNDLMEVYREFGLHRMAPSELVPENTCEDELFAQSHLYNSSLKDYKHPARQATRFFFFWRVWHAAPPGHQLVADMLFMHYSEVFLGAMTRLDDAAPGVTARQLRGLDDFDAAAAAAAAGDKVAPEGKEQRVRSMKSLRGALGLGVDALYPADEDREDGIYMGGGRGDILPPPAWCADERLCAGAGNYRCACTYFPLAGAETTARLVNMVTVASEEEGTTTTTTTTTPLVLNLNRSQHFVEPSAGRWAVTLNEEAPNLKSYLETDPPAGFHHPIDMKWCLVGDRDSGPIKFEFETVGVPPGYQEEEGEEEEGEGRGGGGQRISGKEGDDRSRRAMAERQQAKWVTRGMRVVVCKPDFIERADFTNSTQVRFRVDGVEAPAEELVQGHMHGGSCVVLEADVVGVGRHRLTVEPLQSGKPYVAVSHVVYPA